MTVRSWEASRRSITGPVFDARVERVERVRRVFSAADGLPNLDEVIVWVDHFGQFDGEYRAFVDINVNRRWTLQRLDEGPWKILSLDHL